MLFEIQEFLEKIWLLVLDLLHENLLTVRVVLDHVAFWRRLEMLRFAACIHFGAHFLEFEALLSLEALRSVVCVVTQLRLLQ